MRTRRLPSSSNPASSGSRSFRAAELRHESVLLHEVVEYLSVQRDDTVLDATVGGAGHSVALAHELGEKGIFIGIDADASALVRAREALKGALPRIHLMKRNFRELDEVLLELKIKHIDKSLFDLGWSAYQLEAGRGFSFLADEPLLMTYDETARESDLTAEIIVNEWEEESIADVIFGWGEERFARRIARRIVEERKRRRIRTSRELADIVRSSYPPYARHARIQPATKTFQALRIAVNDEMGALRDGLRSAWKHLSLGGRIAVITFHSIEDREVKRYFQELHERSEGSKITRRAIKVSEEEAKRNPRSRSAKLRVIEKIAA